MNQEMKIPEKIQALIAGKTGSTDSIGKSGASVITYNHTVLKIEPYGPNSKATLQMMHWLDGKLPVPQIICHQVCEGLSYLLMSRIGGKMSCDKYYLERPGELTSLLAEGLQMLWNTDISDCPRTCSLEAQLEEARDRVENHLVDIDDADPDTFGKNGFKSPAHLLCWLEENKPSWEPVLSHGDYCLPNIFLENGRITGFIDLGNVGICDKWEDIAMCYRSLKHNFDGTYGGKVYPDFHPDMLFEKLGIEPNWEKIRYYILLDELF